MSAIINLQMLGRFGNNAVQYLHARALAEATGSELRTPRWEGERIFQIPKTAEPDYSGAYLHGYFQNQESVNYTLSQVRSWFKFQPWVEESLGNLKPDREMVVAHLRRGDYVGYSYPMISMDSYYRACVCFGFPPTKLCFVSEENPTQVTGIVDWLPDFYMMCKATTLLRANSTFSLIAGMLCTGTVLSPNIDGLKGGEVHDVDFVMGNHKRLTNLEGITDMRAEL
jgi:hypothetical protein